MTGEDVEVVCGDWEIGDIPYTTSGEEYNVVLPIQRIVRHPQFEIVRGNQSSQYVENDIAAIVDITTTPVDLSLSNSTSKRGGKVITAKTCLS